MKIEKKAPFFVAHPPVLLKLYFVEVRTRKVLLNLRFHTQSALLSQLATMRGYSTTRTKQKELMVKEISSLIVVGTLSYH